MQNLSSFPMLDDELMQKVRINCSPYRFYYNDSNGEEHDLTPDESTSSSVHPLTDERGCWSPDTDGFKAGRKCTIRTASFLFGKDGIACCDASLALALIWTSSDSRSRSAIEIGAIENVTVPQTLTLDASFPSPKFRGRVDLQIAIVIRKAGHPKEDEAHLANIPGTVIGVIDSFSLQFDGLGSSFPIVTVHQPDGLLWQVQCGFDDVLSDRFDETVAILLNRAHRDYCYLDPTDRKYNPSFLREILAMAVATIVDQVREVEGSDWKDVKDGKAEEGSVGQVIYYFASALDLKMDDPKQCSTSFRDYFNRNLSTL